MKIPDLSLYLITDRHQTLGRDLLIVLEEAIRGGIRAIQLREKDLSAKDLYSLATSVRKLTREANVKLFINDRFDVALAVEADGVHLGQQSLPPDVIRHLVEKRGQSKKVRPTDGSALLIGVSTHNLQEAQRAENLGADFITFGPLFFTPSKAPYGKPVGMDALREVRKSVSIPILGLGGIKEELIPQVLSAGADGISVISAILSMPEVCEATKGLMTKIKVAI
jgi:thiamine-phosphate pyrophosphorylase